MDRGNLLGAGTVRLSAWEMEEFDINNFIQ